MVGWITSRDLREVLLASMLEEIKVGDVMVQAPISVTPDTDVEEAARLIHEHKIGGMPVMEGDKLVGVITMMDLISAFITMLGLLKSSSRLDLLLPNRSEALDAAARLIKKAGGKVINVALGPIQGDKRPYYFRLEKVSLEPIVSTLKQRRVTRSWTPIACQKQSTENAILTIAKESLGVEHADALLSIGDKASRPCRGRPATEFPLPKALVT